jgi:hypothetical protein
MAQDPESEGEDREDQPDEGSVDPSASFDMVTLFSSGAIDAEMEANNIHSLLEASGVPSMVVGDSVIPVFQFQVQVPRAQKDLAERLLEEARSGGPEAAAEAEAAGEQDPNQH